jgi:hypothetical protein
VQRAKVASADAGVGIAVYVEEGHGGGREHLSTRHTGRDMPGRSECAPTLSAVCALSSCGVSLCLCASVPLCLCASVPLWTVAAGHCGTAGLRAPWPRDEGTIGQLVPLLTNHG